MSQSDTVARALALAEESFIASSGPGGQNVNKVATAVQLHAQFRNSVSAAVTTPHTSMVCPFLGRMSG